MAWAPRRISISSQTDPRWVSNTCATSASRSRAQDLRLRRRGQWRPRAAHPLRCPTEGCFDPERRGHQHHEPKGCLDAAGLLYRQADQGLGRLRPEPAGHLPGQIRQARNLREDVTDKVLVIIATDSGDARNFAVVNKSLASGHTHMDRAQAAIDALKALGVQQGYIDTAALSKIKFPRGPRCSATRRISSGRSARRPAPRGRSRTARCRSSATTRRCRAARSS